MSPEALMLAALDQARSALVHDEVPIGCIIYHHPTSRIIGAAHNRRIIDCDPTAHAEILAIRQAAKVIGDWRLLDTTLAVTLEPCPMCAGAIINARIPNVLYGCADPKAGAVNSLFTLLSDHRLNHRPAVTSGILAEDCSALLTTFFQSQRAKGKK